MLQRVSLDCDFFEFWDVAALRDDPELASMYEIWYDRMAYFAEQNGLEMQQISYLVWADTMAIIQADYDINTFRDGLGSDFYLDSKDGDMEVWKSPSNVSGSWILKEGLLVSAGNTHDIDDFIEVMNGEIDSMYDENAAALLQKLPEGVVTWVTREPYPPGIVIYGMSFEKIDEDTFQWNNIHKFENIETASSAEVSQYFQGIEDSFQETLEQLGDSSPYHDLKIDQDGEYIIWSSRVNIQTVTSLLFYG